MELPETIEDKDRIASEEGFRIFVDIRKKFNNNSERDLDMVLNSICAALVQLFNLTAIKNKPESCVELIKKIIINNIKRFD